MAVLAIWRCIMPLSCAFSVAVIPATRCIPES